jgi:tripartite ATP-independent transporter DctP family solute receptor
MIRGISIFLIFLITTSCGNLGKSRILKLGHGLDTSHPVHLAMVFMAERLEEKSAGKMKLEIYPAGQLGQERECLELLQIGSLAMTKVSAQIMENFAPDFQVFGLPYIFRDREHAFMVFDGPVGEKLLNEGRKFWLLGLTFYDAGSRSFYTKDKPIFKPDDLRSLKIRVMPSTTAMNTVRAFGGSPTPIPWGELYTALQQGVVDGAENNSPSFYFSHHYEVCKYYSLNEHTIIPDVLLISTHVWDRLSESEKKWVTEAAEESSVYERKVWHDSEIKCLEEVKKAGVEIIYPDKAPFADKTQKVYDDYRDNPSISELIMQIRETR